MTDYSMSTPGSSILHAKGGLLGGGSLTISSRNK